MLEAAVVLRVDLGVLPIGHLETSHPERALDRNVVVHSAGRNPDQTHRDAVAQVEVQVILLAGVGRGSRCRIEATA